MDRFKLIKIIVNAKTIAITAAAVVSTWLCSYYNIKADFPMTLVATAVVFPIVFSIGAAWWILAQIPMFLATPDWPRWSIFAVAGFAAVGYAVADLMPWAMLGETIDEGELESGVRRDGLYTGAFTFIRKIAGGTGVLLSGFALSAAGYEPGQAQSASALLSIRLLTAAAPALLLAAAIVFALRYPLSRARHEEIRRGLDARSGIGPGPEPVSSV